MKITKLKSIKIIAFLISIIYKFSNLFPVKAPVSDFDISVDVDCNVTNNTLKGLGWMGAEIPDTEIAYVNYGYSSIEFVSQEEFNTNNTTLNTATIEILPFDKAAFVEEVSYPEKIVHLRTTRLFSNDGPDGIFGRATEYIDFTKSHVITVEYFFKNNKDTDASRPNRVGLMHPTKRYRSLDQEFEALGLTIEYSNDGSVEYENFGRYTKCKQDITIPALTKEQVNTIFGTSKSYCYLGLWFDDYKSVDCYVWGLSAYDNTDKVSLFETDTFDNYKLGENWVYKYAALNDTIYNGSVYMTNNEGNFKKDENGNYVENNVWIQVEDFNLNDFPADESMIRINASTRSEICFPISIEANHSYYVKFSLKRNTEYSYASIREYTGINYYDPSDRSQYICGGGYDGDEASSWYIKRTRSTGCETYEYTMKPLVTAEKAWLTIRLPAYINTNNDVYTGTDTIKPSDTNKDLYLYDVCFWEYSDDPVNQIDMGIKTTNTFQLNNPNGVGASTTIDVKNTGDIDVDYSLNLSLSDAVPSGMNVTIDGVAPTTVSEVDGRTVLTFPIAQPLYAGTTKQFILQIVLQNGAALPAVNYSDTYVYVTAKQH